MRQLILTVVMLAVLLACSGCRMVAAVGFGIREVGNIVGNVVEAGAEDGRQTIKACSEKM